MGPKELSQVMRTWHDKCSRQYLKIHKGHKRKVSTQKLSFCDHCSIILKSKIWGYSGANEIPRIDRKKVGK